MLFRFAIVLEVLSIIICIHYIYDVKVKIDIKTMLLAMIIIVTSTMINCLDIDNINTLIFYIVIYGYCKSKFKESVLETMVSVILVIIIITVLQYICVLPAYAIFSEYIEGYVFTTNLLAVLLCYFLLPKCKLSELKNSICHKNKVVVVMLVFCTMVIGILLLQGKIKEELAPEYFILVIPAIIFLLWITKKWIISENNVENVKKELILTQVMQEKYEELLINVRMRQHEFKNHLAAIFSTHYTYKTYEQLVKAQEQYYSVLQRENRYSNLLFVGNKVIGGFLYSKFQEAEEDGVIVEYEINAKLSACRIHAYYLIEMIGILFDNAVEALTNEYERKIYFSIKGDEEAYWIVVRNRFRYVSYTEIEDWFRCDISTKGKEHGIGLYHLKCLCKEWDCDIKCENVEVNKENWIEFSIKIDKAGSL